MYNQNTLQLSTYDPVKDNEELRPYYSLWRAVITQAVSDALQGRDAQARLEAEQYLASVEASDVADVTGLSIEAVREYVAKNAAPLVRVEPLKQCDQCSVRFKHIAGKTIYKFGKKFCSTTCRTEYKNEHCIDIEERKR